MHFKSVFAVIPEGGIPLDGIARRLGQSRDVASTIREMFNRELISMNERGIVTKSKVQARAVKS